MRHPDGSLTGPRGMPRRTHKTADSIPDSRPGNRESCIVVGVGSASGDTIPAFIIFNTLLTLEYAHTEGDPDLRSGRTPISRRHP